MAAVTVWSDFWTPRKSVTAFTFSPSIYHEVMGPDAMILVFWMLTFKPAFPLSSFTPSRGSLVSLYCLPLEQYHLHIWGSWYISWQSWFQLVIHPAHYFVWYTSTRLRSAFLSSLNHLLSGVFRPFTFNVISKGVKVRSVISLAFY